MSRFTPEVQPANQSPLQKIISVVLGSVGTEASLGLLIHPDVSRFEANAPGGTSIVEARNDHDRFRHTLESDGIEVFNFRQIIGEELARNTPNPFKTARRLLDELHNRANLLHAKYGLGDLDQAKEELGALLAADMQLMGEEAALAFNAVVNNAMSINGEYLPFDLGKPPAANFMFLRDQSHAAPSRVGTHRMFFNIRDQEVQLTELGFKALGVEYQRVLQNGQGTLEGGDIMPMELNNQLYALIGTAERTSLSAVYAWFQLHEKSFSASGEGIIPLVVKGPTENTQTMMHLDTFAAQIAPGAIIHCGEITRQRSISILAREKGEIVMLDAGSKNFADWIERHATQVYDMTVADQENYAPNVLVDGSPDKSTTVYVTRDGSPEVLAFIRQNARRVVELKMNQLTHLYGGAHCATNEYR